MTTSEIISGPFILKNKRLIRPKVLVSVLTYELCRLEWAMARFCQVVPYDWGFTQSIQSIPLAGPVESLAADAMNVLAKGLIESEADWFIFIKGDAIIPPDCFLRFGEYIKRRELPIVSALSFTKSKPSDPLVTRDDPHTIYRDWSIRDLVWTDVVPLSCILIHRSIIEVLWDESPKIGVGNPLTLVSAVFSFKPPPGIDPEYDPARLHIAGDIRFSQRLIEENVLTKAGWKSPKQYPFLIDTNIMVRTIDLNGAQFPNDADKEKWTKPEDRKKPAIPA